MAKIARLSSPGHKPLQELQAPLLCGLLRLAKPVLAPAVDLIMHTLVLHVFIRLYAAEVYAQEVLSGDVQGSPAIAWTGACTKSRQMKR